ncbi:MAG: AMP-binding protein [Pirellula sp.]
MNHPNFRSEIQSRDRQALERFQLERLNTLVAKVLPHNAYYQSRFGCSEFSVNSLAEWATFPTSQKSDWLGKDSSGLALHHTFAEDKYRRYHRTSGTRGHPMVILDTQEDWQWWIDTWQYVLDACGILATDRIMMAFSFGPFIGFWSAHDACLHRGCMVIPCGGMSTAARIELIQTARPTVLFSTPSYAMHLAQDARTRQIDLSKSSIRQVFVAGEPGGSLPAVRSRIESMFGASVMDHAGATEVGPWGFGSSDGTAMHVIESEFIAEFLPVERKASGDVATEVNDLAPGVLELVLTSLGRIGAPVFRYRTGDLVKPNFIQDGKCNFVRLESGVLGRTDDMFVIRGVNVFPTSIDAIVRSFPSISDYRLTVTKNGAMDELLLEFESSNRAESTDQHQSSIASRLAEMLSIQLNLRFEVNQVSAGHLPRSEGKARRIFDRR